MPALLNSEEAGPWVGVAEAKVLEANIVVAVEEARVVDMKDVELRDVDEVVAKVEVVFDVLAVED